MTATRTHDLPLTERQRSDLDDARDLLFQARFKIRAAAGAYVRNGYDYSDDRASQAVALIYDADNLLSQILE